MKKDNQKFCGKPFDNFEVDMVGDVRVCCGMWLPDVIGNVNEQSMEEIFNSEKAKELRRSMLDGSFRYCDHEKCPHLVNGDLPDKENMTADRYKTEEATFPVFFNFCNDVSCNLSCPSCRIKIINDKDGPIYQKKKKGNDAIVEYALKNAREHPEREIYMNITGSGDPFGSRIYRDFLFGFDGRKYPNVKINLQTNGVMFTHVYWDRLHKCHENLSAVLVSFDAATPKTYSITRRDGDWGWLLKNFRMLSDKRGEDKLDSLRADYVVQDYNFREMPDFVELLSDTNIDNYVFQKIINWGTYSDEDFERRAIWKSTHPYYEEFLEVLRDDRLRDPRICWGNVAANYNEAHTK